MGIDNLSLKNHILWTMGKLMFLFHAFKQFLHKIIFLEKQAEIVPDVDISMTGNVTWAGKSSMEVTTTLQQVGRVFSTSMYMF